VGGVIRIVSAAFGGVIAASTGYIQLKKLLEAGIISRIIMARLQKEYNSFMLRAGKYSVAHFCASTTTFHNTFV
jgi:hypothetical protein